MKKVLLLCAAALFSLMASAGDGIVVVGANVILLPSSYFDSDIEWKAWTWVYTTAAPNPDGSWDGVAGTYGDWNTDNPNYNEICGVPYMDSEGREWFEPGFNMAETKYNEIGDLADVNWDVFDDEGNELPINWEEHTAPFSSDKTFNGRTSYMWTGSGVMADIYVRRTFTTDQLLSGPVYLSCGHDDAPCEYYINGVLVFERTGYEGEREETDDQGNTHIVYNQGWNNAEYILLTDEQKALIKLNGEENVIAFHVHQNWGGAFADCGLYTKVEGGLEMGYVEPWEAKVLFNNIGGFGGHIINNQPDVSTKNPWSKLYEAQEGDVYTFTLPGSCNESIFENATIYDDYTDEDGNLSLTWNEQLHFKTPIRIEEGRDYRFRATLKADKPFSEVVVKLTDNDYDKFELAYETIEVEAPEPEAAEEYTGTPIEIEFQGIDSVYNFKIAFDFGGGQDSTTVSISDMSLVEFDDNGEEKELWIGTHYFNYFFMTKATVKYLVWDDEYIDEEGNEGGYREAKNEEEIENAEEIIVTGEVVDAPEMTGRVETKAWTLADFDDSMWNEQMMPVSGTYPNNYWDIVPESLWPGGDNTNYWIRRNFELDKVNERLEYQLNVCHDDTYETYVNGHLLQKNTGWTDGKNPVQVHIPARYLNVGKNVIATYIQQNWGGRFYDCGINVTEVNYEDCIKQFNDAIAYANTDTLLTNRMKEDIQDIIAKAQQFYQENKNDAAELRSYARDTIRAKVNAIFAHSSSLKVLKDTWEICRKMEDKGYWGTALEDVTIALDTCAVPSQWSSVLTNLREARKATAMERRTEKFVGTVPEVVSFDEIGDWDMMCPKYYIYNVGAKLFLGGGESWGTHLALEYDSNPMMLVQAMKDITDDSGDVIDSEAVEGAFYVETFRPNGSLGEGDFMGWNGYVDVGIGSTWELIPVEGKENVFNIAQYGQTFGDADTTCYNGTIFEPGGKKLLGLRSGDNRYAPSYYVVDTDMHSPELETNQWMFISREEMLGFIKTASVDNPVDVSFLINNPGYDQRWTIDDWIFTNGSVFGRGGDRGNFVLESYNTTDFYNYQDLWPEEGEEALPAGTYKLMVQGYYRDGIENAHVDKVIKHQEIKQRALIFAGPEFMDESSLSVCETMPLMPIHIEANKVPGIGYTYKGMQMPGTVDGTKWAGEDYFPCGLYWNEFVFTISEDDPGHLTFGICKEYDEELAGKGDWIVMDNWRIKFYGSDPIDDPDAIKGVTSDEINKVTPNSKNIYNMLGQRLSKTQKGVNIINGKKIIKK